MAFLAYSARCFLAFRKEPDFENTVPRYLYVSTNSRVDSPNVKLKFSVFLAPNIIILVLDSLTVSFQSMQYV